MERKLSPEQTTQRDRLEMELTTLRRRKGELAEDEYFAELERVLTTIARLYVDAK